MANRWFTQFFGSLEKKPVVLSCDFVVDSTNLNGLGIRALKGPGISSVFMATTASFSGDTHTNLVVDGISSTDGLVVGQTLTGTGFSAGTTIASITSSSAITLNQATTATNSSVTISVVAAGNPNPSSGLIVVKFQDNFSRYLFGTSGFVSPLSGSAIHISTGSSLTIGHAYVITVLGTSTTANWVAVGLPVGTAPAVGVSFIASATSGTGTGQVQVASVSGVTSIEVVGDANLSIVSLGPTVLGGTQASGAYMVLQCLGPSLTMASYTPVGTNSAPALTMDSYTPAGVITNGSPDTFAGTPATLTGTVAAPVFTGAAHTLTGTVSYAAVAPASGSVVGLSFFFSNSVIKVQGQ